MGEASGKNRANKPNAIEIWTAMVLTITMVAVVWYTWEADRQNEFTKRAIETASRPYLAVSAHEQGFTTAISSASAGGAIAVVPFYVVNHGKLPADAHIKSAVVYSKTRIPAIDGLDSVKEKHRFIFSETSGDALVALDREALTSGQLTDIQSGIGFIYVAVEVATTSQRFAKSFPSQQPKMRHQVRSRRRGSARTRYVPIPNPTTRIDSAGRSWSRLRNLLGVEWRRLVGLPRRIGRDCVRIVLHVQIGRRRH
jgi:hypothetical protein